MSTHDEVELARLRKAQRAVRWVRVRDWDGDLNDIPVMASVADVQLKDHHQAQLDRIEAKLDRLLKREA